MFITLNNKKKTDYKGEISGVSSRGIGVNKFNIRLISRSKNY